MKRGEELAPLSWDHHHGLVLAFRLKRGLNRNADGLIMADYVKQAWENSLKPHFDKEERFLIKPLEKYSKSADLLIRQLKRDHLFFGNMINKIKTKNSNLKSYLQEFAEALEKHIRFEEREFFPAVEKQVPPKQLALIGRSIHALYQTVDMCWTPEFWQG
jgi:hemerythrin-like domain-containing protein